MILLTGNLGYIGTVMTRMLNERSDKVVGVDSDYYHGCELYPQESFPHIQLIKDIREIYEKDLEGSDAIIHLAALSNDPLGEINPALTENANFLGSLRLAKLAKKVGVSRFIFASSCSIYGISTDDKPLTEKSALNPITAYARSKVKAEKEIAKLADANFHPVFMRNATVYGVSPKLRLDLVVNNLTVGAFLTGEINIMSDGTPWRPIVHIEDFCRAFIAALEAPVEDIHNEVFNVGITQENYQIKDIAQAVASVIPNSRARILNKTDSDERTYRVDFSKIKKMLPNFKPTWNLQNGIKQLYQIYKDLALTQEDFQSSKYFRVRWIRHLIEDEKLDNDLRWL